MKDYQKKAIKRICKDYDFEDYKELKQYLKEDYGDTLDQYWFDGQDEETCYQELNKLLSRNL